MIAGHRSGDGPALLRGLCGRGQGGRTVLVQREAVGSPAGGRSEPGARVIRMDMKALTLILLTALGLARTLWGWELVTLLPLILLVTMLLSGLINLTVDRVATVPGREDRLWLLCLFLRSSRTV